MPGRDSSMLDRPAPCGATIMTTGFDRPKPSWFFVCPLSVCQMSKCVYIKPFVIHVVQLRMSYVMTKFLTIGSVMSNIPQSKCLVFRRMRTTSSARLLMFTKTVACLMCVRMWRTLYKTHENVFVVTPPLAEHRMYLYCSGHSEVKYPMYRTTVNRVNDTRCEDND